MNKLKDEVEVEKLKLHLDHVFEYGVNFKDRIIQLVPHKTELDDSLHLDVEHFAFLDAALTELESYNRSAITIKVCSYGGSVDAALAIIGRIKASKCKIVIEGYGVIASAATLILACGDERRISRFSSFMYHECNFGIEDGTRLSAIKAEVELAERGDKLWAKWMSEFSDQPPEFYEKTGIHIDKYWTPEQLLEYGIVDKII